MKIDRNDPINKIIFPDKKSTTGCMTLIVCILLCFERLHG